MIKHLLSVLLFASAAHAVDFYLDTDCANHGDGTTASCAGSPGGAGAFNNLVDAEDDLEAETGSVTLFATGTAKDTTSVRFEGGSWTDFTLDGQNEYVLEPTGYNWPLDVRGVQNLTIKNLKIGRGGTGSLVATAVYIAGADGDFNVSSVDGFVMENVEIYDVGGLTSPDGTSDGFVHIGALQSNETVILRNVFIRDSKFQNNLMVSCRGGETVRLHNITVIDAVAGNGVRDEVFDSNCATIETINVLSAGNFGDDFSQTASPTTRTNTTNASSDATSPNAALRNVTVTFDTAPTLAAGDTDVIDQGTTIGAFAYDIFGTSRPQGSAWDIGAHERTSSGSTSIIPLLTEVWGY
jgi:hypothetical protein